MKFHKKETKLYGYQNVGNFVYFQNQKGLPHSIGAKKSYASLKLDFLKSILMIRIIRFKIQEILWNMSDAKSNFYLSFYTLFFVKLTIFEFLFYFLFKLE